MTSGPGAGQGWYPSPDDPSTLRWWDGSTWTTHTRPAFEPAPTATPATWAPGPPQRTRKGRRVWPFVLMGGALVLALVIALVAVLALRTAPLRFDGRTIAEPEDTLSEGEDTIADIVDARHGASNDDTRCYYSLPEDEESEVNPFLRCGPVLFVDGDPDAAYLTLPFEGDGGEGDVTLAVADEPQSPDPAELESGENLRRPDGLQPAADNGGLEVPPPPPADPGMLLVDPLEGIDLDAPETEAILVSFTRSMLITGLARPDRIGQGDAARRPADDEIFLAVEFDITSGREGSSSELPTMEIQIGDEAPVPAPEELRTVLGTVGLLLSVPDDTEAVDLVVSEVGVAQRISLLTGEPGPDNISVLRRVNRFATVGATAPLTFTVSAPGFVSESFTITPVINSVDLVWYFGSAGTIHPADPNRAYMVLDLDLIWPPPFPADTALEEPFWRLDLPDGTSVGATNVDEDPVHFVTIAFEVPADFTQGTIVVGGAHTFPDNNQTFDFGANQLIAPVSIPAG